MSVKILIADTDPEITNGLKASLEKEKYKVLLTDSGKKALEIALREIPQLILLDINTREMDGIETCLELRDNPILDHTLITFFTTRNEEYSQIAALDAGADDYILKPVKTRLLMSKIRSLLRRKNDAEPKETGERRFVIDRERYLLVKDQHNINLPRKEFELIALLASKPKKVFTREEILDNVWGKGYNDRNRTIDVHIRKLRNKVGERHIKTVKGIGYCFEE